MRNPTAIVYDYFMNSTYTFNLSYFHEKTLLAVSKHILMWTLVALPFTGFTQTSFNASDCREIQATDGRANVDLCNSHTGCRMVLENRKTCTNAKKFLTHLLEAIGPGTKGVFGFKREVTPEAIFQASAVETKSVAEVNVNATENAKKIQALLATQEKRELSEKPTVLGNTVLFKGWVYYGEVADGKANGQGTKIYSDGLIQRGKFTAGVMNGLAETIFPSGTREIGFFESGYKQGQVFTAVVAEQGVVGIDGDFHLGKLQNGKITQPDGSFFEGSFNEQGRLRGRHVRANGTLIDEGSYKENQLFIGKTYDAQGKLTAQVNKPREQEISAIAASRAEEARKLEAQTQEQKRRDSVAASEQTFRDSLSSMNAGQLFAKADELGAQGDKAKARETLRLLVSKFPDHALAEAAAQQMATMSAASGNSSSGSTNNSSSSSGVVSNISTQSGGAGKCWDILAAKEKEYETINRRPVPQGATPGLMRVIWMTEDSIKVIDANCAGDAKAAKYRGELETAYNQAKTACGQLTAGGQCKANAFDGTTPVANVRVEDPSVAAAAASAAREAKSTKDLQDFADALKKLAEAAQARKNGGASGSTCNKANGGVCTQK